MTASNHCRVTRSLSNGGRSRSHTIILRCALLKVQILSAKLEGATQRMPVRAPQSATLNTQPSRAGSGAYRLVPESEFAVSDGTNSSLN